MKKLKTNPFRLGIQIAIMLIIIVLLIIPLFNKEFVADFEATCPFGGLQAFASFLINNSLTCTMTSIQIAFGAALVLAVVLFSKLFCSYICPIGTISEWLGKLGEKWKVRVTISGTLDKVLRILKYVLLFITLYFTLTSSELACKWFCPYFSTVTAFHPDVNVIMGIAALVIVVFGSIFFRLFWCKYICPLGAISNIFRFFLMFAITMVVYVLIRIIGVELSFVWPLAVSCILGYGLELLSMRSKTFPLFKIKRHEDLCTNCKLCTKHCPMALEVHNQDTVKHIDCHMCGDCIEVCPEKGALTINKKGRKWWPALVLVILILAAFIGGRSFELPTLTEYWGEEGTEEEMEIYTISGMESVKCFSSSQAVANRLYDMDGIYGVTTFVKDHTLKIWFDPDAADTLGIQEWLFTPAYVLVAEPPADATSLSKYLLEVENFFDSSDDLYLGSILMDHKSIYGFETDFACPVKVTIYLDSRTEITRDELKDIVEQKLKDGVKSDVHQHYGVVTIKEGKGISAEEFREMFLE